jgi:hypothetical protein
MGGKRMWLIGLVAMVVAGGIAAAVVVAVRGRKPTESHVPAPATSAPSPAASGKLKFSVEPADAEIRIEGQSPHAGSPWTVELAAGIHPIEVRRTGYKSWLTSLELSAGESQLVRVELAPLGSTTATGDATLSIATTPPGLDATLDGHVLPEKTPIKLTVKVGQHVVTVRQNGVDAWKQSFHAEPSSDYEFHPSFSAEKQRERELRAAPAPAPAPAAVPKKAPASPAKLEPAAAPTPATASATETQGSAQPEAKAPEPPPEPKPEPPPEPKPPEPKPVLEPAKPAVATTPAPAPAPAPRPVSPSGKPVIVPPSAVTKLSGTTPSLRIKSPDLPPVIAAKLCIDAGGNVTSVDVLSKIERHAVSDLSDALHGWHYAPYKQGGGAIPACFVVSFKIQ